jgi:hypothetical protein
VRERCVCMHAPQSTCEPVRLFRTLVLLRCRHEATLAGAKVIVMDANVGPDTIKAVCAVRGRVCTVIDTIASCRSYTLASVGAQIAEKHGVPVVCEPTSAAKCIRIHESDVRVRRMSLLLSVLDAPSHGVLWRAQSLSKLAVLTPNKFEVRIACIAPLILASSRRRCVSGTRCRDVM